NFINSTPAGQPAIQAPQAQCAVNVTGSSATPTPTTAASADFVAPEENQIVNLGQALETRVSLTGTDVTQLACEQWLLDGVPMSSAQWVGGSAPAPQLSPCP